VQVVWHGGYSPRRGHSECSLLDLQKRSKWRAEMGTGPEGPVSVARLSRAPFGHAARRTARMSTLSLAVVILDIRT
jgi:hypothetical protein